MWVSGQLQDPAVLPPGKSTVNHYTADGGPQGRFGRVRRRDRTSDHPARSELPCRLSYPGQ
jgi:hypothetical protein